MHELFYAMIYPFMVSVGVADNGGIKLLIGVFALPTHSRHFIYI
jgi:hypothetical protein